MRTATLEWEIVTANEEEMSQLARFSDILPTAADVANVPTATPQLLGGYGEKMDIPVPIYKVLVQIVPMLLQGDAIALVPYHKELTTQEAADFLNLSRQYLVRLLDTGVIPHHKVGRHRRLRFKDVLEYKEKKYGDRKRNLDHMTALADEAGEYE